MNPIILLKIEASCSYTTSMGRGWFPCYNSLESQPTIHLREPFTRSCIACNSVSHVTNTMRRELCSLWEQRKCSIGKNWSYVVNHVLESGCIWTICVKYKLPKFVTRVRLPSLAYSGAVRSFTVVTFAAKPVEAPRTVTDRSQSSIWLGEGLEAEHEALFPCCIDDALLNESTSPEWKGVRTKGWNYFRYLDGHEAFCGSRVTYTWLPQCGNCSIGSAQCHLSWL